MFNIFSRKENTNQSDTENDYCQGKKQQMLVRMQRKRSPYSLLLRV
jgi:hypothetical protein